MNDARRTVVNVRYRLGIDDKPEAHPKAAGPTRLSISSEKRLAFA